MARSATSQRDTSIRTYRAKRDITASSEPAPTVDREPAGNDGKPIFVVQKHRAHRAGLHWDFRLEHNNVLWSWAVRKGPSLDPNDKRMAAHVEDHPVDYADFQGSIPDGNYGAGSVETWDRGTWEPLLDPDEGLRDGEVKFVLHGKRLNGKFTLVRLRPKPNQRSRQDNWLLIKGHDEYEQRGGDAEALEATVALPKACAAEKFVGHGKPPAPAAKRRSLPDRPAPQLASVADEPPEGDDWLSEVKFDGYRLLASVQDGQVTLTTRNSHDWTDRLPAVTAAVRRLNVTSALIDGELVALDDHGVSSFPSLQAALSNGRDETLFFYLFDLLHLDGWDLQACALHDRKRLLFGLDTWQQILRYSDHHEGDVVRMRQAACRMKLEGIICKQIDAPYEAGRGYTWLKVKCQGREELVVLGWTAQGSPQGLGSLHLGYYDPSGNLHYAGCLGSGFSDEVLKQLHDALAKLPATPPTGLLVAGDDLEKSIHWVKPSRVVETSITAWSGAGRVRHAVYLGLREDKEASEVVREIASPDAVRRRVDPRQPKGLAARGAPVIVVPPKRTPMRNAPVRTSSAIVTTRAPNARAETIEGITLTHGDRALWPGDQGNAAESLQRRGKAGTRNGGISKRDLVRYWQQVADHALPGIAKRPLAIVRCPEGVDGEHFFQKHARGTMPAGVRDGVADKAPFLAIDDLQGLVAMAQMSAVELHVWGATEGDPLHADQLVFDLDPGDGVGIADIVAAALDLRDQLAAIGLTSFCRTSGGKGLHIVVPLHPEQPWDRVRAFCKGFAESVSEAQPDKYLAHVRIADRRGRVLIDWLRNGLGSTAVASFSPRARPGAAVATPLAWQEVNAKLDPRAFTLQTVPNRLAKLRTDPWTGFEESRGTLPTVPKSEIAPRPAGKATIVTAKAPQPRSKRP